MSDTRPVVVVPDMCATHQSLLVQQANYSPHDTWRALVVMTNVALMQGALCDAKVYAEIGEDITRLREIGCLACRKPDLFGEIVEVAKSHDLGKIKALGEKWIADSQSQSPTQPLP